jgi:hypothetical protein
MKRNTFFVLLSAIIIFSMASCKCQKSAVKANDQESVVKIIAPVIIYKTNGDYNKNVAVMLSDDKTDIISYPDITDVFYAGKLAYPTQLENGYLLDNRGVNKNTAFIKYTYEEYSKLPATPQKEELMKMIISKNSIIELYKCDKLPKNDIQKLNESIKQGLPNVCNNLMK